MQVYGDYHTHTTASDGHCTVKQLAARARELGLKELAITDHSFCSFLSNMTFEKFYAQKKEIESERRDGLYVLQGIEGNIISADGELDVPAEAIRGTDILLAGFHRFVNLMSLSKAREYVFVNGYLGEREKRKMKDANTASFIGVIKNYPIDVISHLGHRTPVDFRAVAKAAFENGVYIELNAKHLFDTVGISDHIREIADEGVNFIMGSDAHNLRRVADFDGVEKFMKENGIDASRVFGVTKRPVFKDRSGYGL